MTSTPNPGIRKWFIQPQLPDFKPRLTPPKRNLKTNSSTPNMSNQNSNFFSYSSSSFSSSTRSSNGRTTGHSYYATSHSNPSGTTQSLKTQNMGEPVIEETRRYDSAGRMILEDGRVLGQGTSGARGRIEDVKDDGGQAERDRLYEERMEDEYAKREGGA